MSVELELLKKVKNIEIHFRRIIKKGLLGDYKSAVRGTGMQFREFRQYVYGDDVRHIAWSVSARERDPVLKVFEEERDRSLLLLVDVSGSFRRGPMAKMKAERMAEVAATLALAAHESKDKLGLVLFSDRVEKVVPPKAGRAHLLRVIRDVMLYEPQGRKTRPDEALKQVNQVLKKRSVVFLLSDFEVLPTQSVLKRVQRRHELIGLSISNAMESQLPYRGFIEVEGAESAQALTLHTRSEAMHQHVKSFFDDQSTRAQELFQKSGCALLKINCQDDFIPILRSYFRS